MSQGEGTPGVAVDIEGLSIEEAVEALDGTVGHGREEIRTTLEDAAEDGTVTAGGVEAALTDLSTIVEDAGNRAEVAGAELDDAREAAADVADVESVRARLERFESRLGDVEERAEALDRARQSLVGHAGDVSYAVVRDLRRLRSRARGVRQAADELHAGIESFREWVTIPAERHEAFAADVGAVEEALDELETGVDGLTAGDPAGDAGAAVAWFDATLRHRLTGLLVADLRIELGDLRTLAARQDADPPGTERLDALAARREALDERLDGVARPAWRERFAGELRAFERTLEAYEPPIDWADVHAELDDHRPVDGERSAE